MNAHLKALLHHVLQHTHLGTCLTERHAPCSRVVLRQDALAASAQKRVRVHADQFIQQSCNDISRDRHAAQVLLQNEAPALPETLQTPHLCDAQGAQHSALSYERGFVAVVACEAGDERFDAVVLDESERVARVTAELVVEEKCVVGELHVLGFARRRS